MQSVGEAALPPALRRTRLYRSLVEAVLRFLIEQLGEVEGVFPAEGKIADDFLVRRTAGNGLELIGILTFHASPVWILAALADLSGAGRTLIAEIAAALREEGLIAPDSRPATMDQILDALEATAGRAAEAINTPPLDIRQLREEWAAIQNSARGMTRSKLPSIDSLTLRWHALQDAARQVGRSTFELSTLLALDALQTLPRRAFWLGRSSVLAARTTGGLFAENILEHYSDTLEEIRQTGLTHWWRLKFRPYLAAAARHLSPETKRAPKAGRPSGR